VCEVDTSQFPKLVGSSANCRQEGTSKLSVSLVGRRHISFPDFFFAHSTVNIVDKSIDAQKISRVYQWEMSQPANFNHRLRIGQEAFVVHSISKRADKSKFFPGAAGLTQSILDFSMVYIRQIITKPVPTRIKTTSRVAIQMRVFMTKCASIKNHYIECMTALYIFSSPRPCGGKDQDDE
jgi:hypothetical protein